MDTENIYGAKTRLSQLVDKAAAGEDVAVSSNGKPLVRITRLLEPKRQVRFGVLAGKLSVPADFAAPLPAEVLKGFEGRFRPTPDGSVHGRAGSADDGRRDADPLTPT